MAEYDWYRALPKIELHAHLHGCVRMSTLKELCAERDIACNMEAHCLDSCFQIFAFLHKVISSRDVLTRIVTEAVEDFDNENVKYLELRTTPRTLSDGTNVDQYVASIASTLDRYHARSNCGIAVRLLLSIDRNGTLKAAEDTVKLTMSWRDRSPYIVGLDFCGNALEDDSGFTKFESIFREARKQNLRISMHFAEHFDETEAERILQFRPDRLGHACCLSRKLYEQMIAARIPIEVCLTSNVVTMMRKDVAICGCPKSKLNICLCLMENHIHRQLICSLEDSAYPLCLCTDDPGVFCTSLTTEYARAAHAFGLTKQQVWYIAGAPISMLFDTTQQLQMQKIFSFPETHI